MHLNEYEALKDIQNDRWWFRAKRDLLYGLLRKEAKKGSRPKILDVGFANRYGFQFRSKESTRAVARACLGQQPTMSERWQKAF